MTANSLTDRALTGHHLDAFLDEAQALLDEEDANDESGESSESGKSDAKTRLADLFAGQGVRPDRPEVLRRLAWLWVQAGKPAQAVQALQRHQAAVLSALPPAERLEAQGDLLFSTVNALREQADRPDAPADANARLKAAVAEAARLLATYPLDRQGTHGWEHLRHVATTLSDHALARQCIEARHTVGSIDPDRATYRAWDEAQLATRLAHTFAAEGDAARAEELAGQAIAKLAGAAPGQDVDEDDWLNLSAALLPLASDRIGLIVQYARACLGASASPALQRDLEVRAARLRARALHDQGRTEEALVQARLGRFALTSDSSDVFSVMLLDLLVQAGQHDEAARLAFECVWATRPGSGHYACKLALQHVDQSDNGAAFWWALTLACAGAEDYFHDALPVGQKPPEFFERNLALARERSPGHVAVDVVEGYYLSNGKEFERALPLLEKVAQCPDIANSDAVFQLWLTRVHVHGPERGLAQGFVESPAGGWSYGVGVRLDGDLKDEFPDDENWPQPRLEELITRYYERGQMWFEAFFATGKGRFRDGDAHEYSMLCNNLGIQYRFISKEWDKAIALHEKGIAASSFAEHYAGLMWCHKAAERKEAFLDAADRLWHYATENGYSRHDPTEYFQQVSLALFGLDRDAEIPFWLQRLDQWWKGCDEEERAEQADDYMTTLLYVLRMMAWNQPDDALVRLAPLLQEIRTSRNVDHMGQAADALAYARQHESAIEWCQSALAATDPGKEENKDRRETWIERIAYCKKALQGQRPWWKKWG